MNMPTTLSRQRGVSLVVTLVLVILLSLLALYGAGILVLDTRSAANDFRQREGLSLTESGIEQGFSIIDVNRKRFLTTGFDMNGDGDTGDTNEAWADCDAEDWCKAIRGDDRDNWQWVNVSSLTTDPTENRLSTYLLTTNSGPSSRFLFYIVAIGHSADDTSTSMAKQGVYFYPIISAAPETPIMSFGEIGGTGTWDVVGNCDKDGKCISAWSNHTMTLGGAGRTCTEHDFLKENSGIWTAVTDSNGNTLQKCSSCSCPLTKAGGEWSYLSKPGELNEDIVMNDSNFPDDAFEYLFGVPYTSYNEIKQEATVLADCSSLNTASSGLIWITGDCSISTNVGTFDKPVLLVVEDADFQMTGGGEFFGLVFVLSTDGYHPLVAGAFDVHMAGGSTLYGAIMSNNRIDMGNGTYKMRYNKAVLENLNRNLTARALSRVTASWSDVQE